MSRVDYSELVEALNQGDERRANELLRELIPRLQDYLKVVMGAEDWVARDVVQQAMLDVFERIRKGKIKNETYIFSYLLKTCKHEYLHQQTYEKRFDQDEDANSVTNSPADQISRLMDEERQQILRSCLEDLDKESRTFILHFLVQPDTTTQQASELFELSEANVRTRKSRITGKLHDCYQRKSRR